MNLFDTDICCVYITDDASRCRMLFCAAAEIISNYKQLN